MKEIKRIIFKINYLPIIILNIIGFSVTYITHSSVPFILCCFISLIWFTLFYWVSFLVCIRSGGINPMKLYINNSLYLYSMSRIYSIYRKAKLKGLEEIQKTLNNTGFKRIDENIYSKDTHIKETRFEYIFLPKIKKMTINIFLQEEEINTKIPVVKKDKLIVNLYIYLNKNLNDIDISNSSENSIYIDKDFNYKVSRKCIIINKESCNSYVSHMHHYPEEEDRVILFANTEFFNNLISEIIWKS